METPPAKRRRGIERVGTAYRIRTGGLRLERAVSWASRRMRRGGRPRLGCGRTGGGRKRGHNEDNYLITEELNLFVGADGMGGHAGGEPD